MISLATRCKILVVDDEQDMLSLLYQILQKHFSVRAVETGELALSAAEKEVFPVVILDLCLPRMSGMETLAKLRRLNARLKAIILTGQPCKESAVKCLNLGAFKYLLKPFSPAELIALVREGIEEFRMSNPSLTSGIDSPNELLQFDLTPREAEVAFRITKGMHNDEIASEMGISIRGVEKHAERIFRKLDVSHRTQMASKIHQWVRRLASSSRTV